MRPRILILAVSILAASAAAAWVFVRRAPQPAPSVADDRTAEAPRADESPARSEARGSPLPVAHVADAGQEPQDSGAIVRGSVVDPLGAPLAGLSVGLRGDEREPPLTSRSGADGSFALAVETDPCEFEVVEPGWTTLRFGEAESGYGLPEPRVVAVRALPLEGIVLEASGSPLANAALAVRVDPQSVEFLARSGSDGRFRFESLPALPGLALRTSLADWRTDERELALPAAEPLRIVLQPAPGQGPVLEGTVVHADGTPAPGARVVLGSARTRADAQGRFRLHCGWCTAETPLVAIAPGLQPAILAGYGARVDAQAPTLPPERLQLPGPELALTGRLVDANGAALKGWRMRLQDPTWLDPGGDSREFAEGESSGREELRTDAQGAFELRGLSARAYTLLAWGRERATRAEIVVRSGPLQAGTRDVRLEAGANAGVRALVGRVQDESGAPLADASVGLGRVARSPGASENVLQGRLRTRSDAAGHFEISGAPPGTLYLVATRPGSLPLRIEIAPAARTDDLTLRLGALRPFRFEGPDGAEGPDRLRALSASGSADLWSLAGALPARGACARLSQGRSERLSVGPEATAIVLYRGLVELARFPAPPRNPEEGALTPLRWP